MRETLPLSAFWFFYLGGLGLFFPYFSLYLKENAGLTGTQVGLVGSLLPLVGMLAQPFWGQLADRTGSRTRVLAAIAAGAAGGQLLLGRVHGFPALVAATMLLAFFGSAVVPQAVAVSLAARPDDGPGGFGRVRVWGTVGFLCFAVGFPYALDHLQALRGWAARPDGPSEPGLGIMFPVAAAVIALAAAAALRVPRGGQQSLRAARGDWKQLLRHRPVLVLLALLVLAYLCLQGPMGLFALLVRADGGSIKTIGHMWIPMLSLEIPLVLYTGVTVQRLGPRGLLALGILAGGVRWTLCGFTQEPAAIFSAQILHGVTVAGLVIGGPLYIEAAVPERLRSTAQGLIPMIGVGLGGVASNAATGWLIDHVGAKAPYRAGGLGALACGLLVLLVLPRPERPPELHALPAPDPSLGTPPAPTASPRQP